MKAAVVIMKYDYGIKERGYSYEYINVYLPLCSVLGNNNVLLFDYYSEYKNSGKAYMNRKLEEFVSAEHPDIIIFCLFEEEFNLDALNRIKDKTKTVAYFIDDPWRKNYAEYWRPFFHYSTTPDYYSYLNYLSAGKKNIIYSPFGFNSDIYKKTELPPKYDISFVGGYSPFRRWVLTRLRNRGINAVAFGRGWGSEWISQEKMVRIFNESRINLNLSNSISFDYRFLLSSLGSFKDLKQLYLLKKNKEQLKGRHYEINGCGGFQMSYYVPGLNLAYEIDKEIAVYEDIDSLPAEIVFFLNNEDLRNRIARAGYERSLKDHTAEGYMRILIEQIRSSNG